MFMAGSSSLLIMCGRHAVPFHGGDSRQGLCCGAFNTFSPPAVKLNISCCIPQAQYQVLPPQALSGSIHFNFHDTGQVPPRNHLNSNGMAATLHVVN
jgi:hypothetical protein